MKQLTFNSQQLLFVKVPMYALDWFELQIHPDDDWYSLEYGFINDDEDSGFYGDHIGDDIVLPAGDYTVLGTIQKENGIVSTTILDEVLIKFIFGADNNNLVETGYKITMSFAILKTRMQAFGIELQEGDKYVVLITK